MDETLEQLEIEVDKDFASLFADSSLPISDEVLVRTKLAVRHALDEQWFTEHENMPVPIEAMARIKTALREELVQRDDDDSVPPARSYTARIGSFVAAAAVIVLCVGLVQYAISLSNPSSASKEALAESLDLFVEAAEIASEEDLLTTIASDLDAIEENLTQWPRESNDWGLEDIESDPNEDSLDALRDSTS